MHSTNLSQVHFARVIARLARQKRKHTSAIVGWGPMWARRRLFSSSSEVHKSFERVGHFSHGAFLLPIETPSLGRDLQVYNVRDLEESRFRSRRTCMFVCMYV